MIGAGGHAQVVADALSLQPGMELVGYVDGNPGLTGQRFLGATVYGSGTDLAAIPHDALIVAIGDNETRRRLFNRYRAKGERFAVARHPKAIVANDVLVGDGAMILAGAILNTGARVGVNAIVNTGAIVEHHVEVGDHSHVAPGTRIGGQAAIGDHALIGIGATVLPRLRIGAGSVVGGGAVVTRSVPDGVTVVGTPARAMTRAVRDA